MGKIIKKRIEYGGSSNSAENIKYDDTKNVKEVINEVNSKLGNTDISAIGDGTLTGGLDALNSNFNNFGSWTPTIEHGTITDSACQYYKIGKLVTLFCAIWGSGDGTDNDVSISLPFPSISVRAYGSVGYFPGAVNYPNLHTIVSNSKLYFEYSSGDAVKHINGKQWGTCQFSITYLAN